MNKHYYKTALLVGCLCLFLACDKDDSPQLPPEPTPEQATSQLEESIAGNYWSEKIYFMSYLPGNPYSIKEYQEDIIEFFQLDGGCSWRNLTTLDKIYVNKDNRKVWRYVTDKYGGYSFYYQNSYTINYDDVNRSIRIHSTLDSLAYMNAVAGSEMQIVSMDENEIVFDAPIKPFIWDNWELYKYFHVEHFLGIRVHWIKANPDWFGSSKPLD